MYQHALGSSPRVAVGGCNGMAIGQLIKLCECGCGRPASLGKRYVQYHGARKTRDVWERIKARCVQIGECLVWQGDTVSGGYGRIRIENRQVLVHRAVYEYFHGPIPDGLTIDHVKARGCNFRACCNDAHLEVVTFRANVLRGSSFAAVHAQKTHCARGHLLNGDNLVPWHRERGRRACRTCRNEWARDYRSRHKNL